MTLKMPDPGGPNIGSIQGNVDRILVITYQGREAKLPLDKLAYGHEVRIGRDPDNDIQLTSPVANLYHATLELRADGCYVIDGQDRTQPRKFDPSTNGIYLNNGRRIHTEHLLESGESFLILAPDKFNVTFTYYSHSEALVNLNPVRLDKPLIRIGRLPDNEMVLPHLTVSALHAVVESKGNNHTIVHKSRTNPTLVNGSPVSTKQDLKPGDKIGIGPFVLEYDGICISPPSGKVDTTGPRVDVVGVSRKVKKFLGKSKTLLDDVTLSIEKGSFVAVVGGSGTGKSTLLKSMIGILPIEKGGRILIDGDDLFANFDRYRRDIGYVPQDDIIHDNLTVEQVLNYVLQLRSSEIGKKRKERIDQLLDTVQLTDRKNIIVSRLSGGQRKRLSMAVELAPEPPILVLDEPTSGLDPGLDQIVMKKLAELSHKQRKTIILVTHATENVGECDKVAFMGAGGHLAFYGRPAEALQFFGVLKFADIYLLLNPTELQKTAANPVDWPAQYRQSAFYQQYIEVPMQKLQAAQGASKAAASKPVRVRKEGVLDAVRQMLILAMRYIQTNRVSLLILLLLPVGLGMMFYSVARQDLFAELKLTLKDLALFAVDKNASDNFFYDVQVIQQVIFMVSTVAVLLGLFGSFQEIVKERSIYERERLVNLNITSYIFSKFIVLAALAALQAILLIYTLHYWFTISGDGLTDLGPVWESIISMFLVLLASVSCGLFVSTLVNRRRDQTTMALIILVTVQILFSGAIFELTGGAERLTWLTFTRWGTEAFGSAIGIDAMSSNNYIKAVIDTLPMEYGDKAFLFGRWGILAAYTVGFLAATVFTLYWQDTVRQRRKKRR